MQYNNIEKLRKILVEELRASKTGKPILLPFESELLQKLILDENYFAESLENVLHLIDFSNVNFDNFIACDFDFSGLFGIKINPQTVFDKDLSCAICDGVEFIGPFDNVCISGANFKGSKGAKVDPQTLYNKTLNGTVCTDVEFIGYFDDVDVAGANFKGSKGAKINPQTICDKSLCGVDCSDVEFIGYFDDVYMEDAKFEGSNYEEIINYEENFRQKIRKLVLKADKENI